MTSTIWKTQLTIEDEQEVYVPAGAEMLWASVQNGHFCVWYRCDSTAPKERRRIRIVGTGHPISDEPWQHIGSCFANSAGSLVFHLFELKP